MYNIDIYMDINSCTCIYPYTYNMDMNSRTCIYQKY